MQSLSDRFPQPPFGKYGKKRYGDNGAYGQDNGRPYKMKWIAQVVVDQNLKPHAQKGGLHEEVQGSGKEGNRKNVEQQGENFYQYGHQYYNWKGKGSKPSAA